MTPIIQNSIWAIMVLAALAPSFMGPLALLRQGRWSHFWPLEFKCTDKCNATGKPYGRLLGTRCSCYCPLADTQPCGGPGPTCQRLCQLVGYWGGACFLPNGTCTCFCRPKDKYNISMSLTPVGNRVFSYGDYSSTTPTPTTTKRPVAVTSAPSYFSEDMSTLVSIIEDPLGAIANAAHIIGPTGQAYAQFPGGYVPESQKSSGGVSNSEKSGNVQGEGHKELAMSFQKPVDPISKFGNTSVDSVNFIEGNELGLVETEGSGSLIGLDNLTLANNSKGSVLELHQVILTNYTGGSNPGTPLVSLTNYTKFPYKNETMVLNLNENSIMVSLQVLDDYKNKINATFDLGSGVSKNSSHNLPGTTTNFTEIPSNSSTSLIIINTNTSLGLELIKPLTPTTPSSLAISTTIHKPPLNTTSKPNPTNPTSPADYFYQFLQSFQPPEFLSKIFSVFFNFLEIFQPVKVPLRKNLTGISVSSSTFTGQSKPKPKPSQPMPKPKPIPSPKPKPQNSPSLNGTMSSNSKNNGTGLLSLFTPITASTLTLFPGYLAHSWSIQTPKFLSRFISFVFNSTLVTGYS